MKIQRDSRVMILYYRQRPSIEQIGLVSAVTDGALSWTADLRVPEVDGGQGNTNPG